MPAEISQSLKDWSTTPGSNPPAGSTLIGGNLDDNLRHMQAAVRADAAATGTIASASTTDIGSNDEGTLTVTGTTTIANFGTVAVGIRKRLVFAGALTLTHNATSLILPGAANITTAAGDSCEMLSLGGGNWRCLQYSRASGAPVAVQTFRISDLGDANAAKTLANAAYTQTWGWAWSLDNSFIGLDIKGGSTHATSSGTVMRISSATGMSSLPKSLLTLEYGGVTIADFTAAPVIRGIGSATLAGGNVTSDARGGSAYIAGGSAHYSKVSSNNFGGLVDIQGGSAYQNTFDGLGGEVRLRGGTGSYRGGRITITSGDGYGGASGGEIYISVGAKSGNYGPRHYLSDVVPIISSGGGAGASIRGCDNAFEVTFGSGSPMNVVVGFATAKTNYIPIVVATGTQAGQVLNATATAAGVTISSNTAFSSGTKVSCFLVDVP